MPPVQTHHQFQETIAAATDQIHSNFLNKRQALIERRQSAETSQEEAAKIDTSELEIQQELVTKDMEIRERLSRQHPRRTKCPSTARKTDNPMLPSQRLSNTPLNLWQVLGLIATCNS